MVKTLRNVSVVGEKVLQFECASPSKRDQLANVLNELISTEERYVQRLETLSEHVMQPAASEQLLDAAQHARVFANVDEILAASRAFLGALARARAGAARPDASLLHTALAALGDMPLEQLYGHYVLNYADAIVALNEVCEQQPALAALARRHDAADLLVEPVQRIARYGSE